MRYGVVRTSPDLPPPTVQRRRIEAAGCDLVLDGGPRLLRRLAADLTTGDEVLIHGLEALGVTTGELARLLRRFFELGVTLRIVGGSQIESLTPQGPLPRALALLADHEAQRPVRGDRRRKRTSGAPLTQHQLRFARQMQRLGHSARSIGLLFQLPPAEMSALLRQDGPRDDAGSPAASDRSTPAIPPPSMEGR